MPQKLTFLFNNKNHDFKLYDGWKDDHPSNDKYFYVFDCLKCHLRIMIACTPDYKSIINIVCTSLFCSSYWESYSNHDECDEILIKNILE